MCLELFIRAGTHCTQNTHTQKDKHALVIIFFTYDYTYFPQMDEYSNRVGNFLVNNEYKKGDAVALFMQNRPEYVCTWLGCAKVTVCDADLCLYCILIQ